MTTDPTLLVGLCATLFGAMIYAVAAEIRTQIYERLQRRAERGEPVLTNGPLVRLVCQIIELVGFGAGQWVLYRGLYGLEMLEPVAVAELTALSLIPLLGGIGIATGTARAFRSYGPA